MSEEQRPEPESAASLEAYDHSVPKGLAGAAAASFFFFSGGQLVKGQFRRALALWGILVRVVAILFLVDSITEPGSTARDIGTYSAGGALVLLWLFQFWDAASHP